MFRLWQKTFVMNTTLGGGVDEDPNPWIGKVEHDFPEYSTNHSSQMNGVPLWGGDTRRTDSPLRLHLTPNLPSQFRGSQ